MSEYGSYVLVAVRGQNSSIDTAEILKPFPKGAGVVHRRFFRGNVRVDEGDMKEKPFEALQADQEGHLQIESVVVAKCLDEEGNSDHWEILSIGVPTDERSFLLKAFEAGHPRTMAIQIVKGVLNRNFSGSSMH